MVPPTLACRILCKNAHPFKYTHTGPFATGRLALIHFKDAPGDKGGSGSGDGSASKTPPGSSTLASKQQQSKVDETKNPTAQEIWLKQMKERAATPQATSKIVDEKKSAAAQEIWLKQMKERKPQGFKEGSNEIMKEKPAIYSPIGKPTLDIPIIPAQQDVKGQKVDKEAAKVPEKPTTTKIKVSIVLSDKSETTEGGKEQEEVPLKIKSKDESKLASPGATPLKSIDSSGKPLQAEIKTDKSKIQQEASQQMPKSASQGPQQSKIDPVGGKPPTKPLDSSGKPFQEEIKTDKSKIKQEASQQLSKSASQGPHQPKIDPVGGGKPPTKPPTTDNQNQNLGPTQKTLKIDPIGKPPTNQQLSSDPKKPTEKTTPKIDTPPWKPSSGSDNKGDGGGPGSSNPLAKFEALVSEASKKPTKSKIPESELLKIVIPKDGDGPPTDSSPPPNRPVRGEPGKVYLCLIPAEWIDFFYAKTGVTGFGTFCFTFATYLISKEIYVMEHEYYGGLSMAIMWICAVKFLGKDTAKALDALIDEYEVKWNQSRVDQRVSLEQSVQQELDMQYSQEGQSVLVEAKRENVHLQLEAEFRKRQMDAYEKVKNILDYHVAIEAQERRFAHENMVNWVYAKVLAAITPEYDARYMDVCMNTLDNLEPQKNHYK